MKKVVCYVPLNDFCKITNRSHPNPEGVVATSFNIMHLCTFSGGKNKLTNIADMMDCTVRITIEEIKEK